MIIRAATADDLDGIMQVMADVFVAAGYGEAWTRGQTASLFALPGQMVAVAEDGDAITAFAAARMAGPESELLLLAVDHRARRSGVGRRLLDYWLHWSEQQGATDHFLEVRANNDALLFYRAAGFTEKGRRPAY